VFGGFEYASHDWRKSLQRRAGRMSILSFCSADPYLCTGHSKPFGSVKEISGKASEQFFPVQAIGPFRLWKRAGRQYHTKKAGDLNLNTGEFLPATFKQKNLLIKDSAVSHGLDAVTTPVILNEISNGND